MLTKAVVDPVASTNVIGTYYKLFRCNVYKFSKQKITRSKEVYIGRFNNNNIDTNNNTGMKYKIGSIITK